MLGAPVSRSADGRYGGGGARRLQTPTPAGAAVVSVVVGSSASAAADKSEGPTAGTEAADPLEFFARVLVHIPDQGQVTTRYYGWYANRPRGMRAR